MGYDCGDKASSRFSFGQRFHLDRLGHLHFVADMFLAMFALPFGGPLGFWVMGVMHRPGWLSLSLHRGFTFLANEVLLQDTSQEFDLLSGRHTLVGHGSNPTEQTQTINSALGHFLDQDLYGRSVVELGANVALPNFCPPAGLG